MTYGELIRAAKFNEPLDDEPTWFQEQVMAFARGWRASPVHYSVLALVGSIVLGIVAVRLSVPSSVRITSTPDNVHVKVDGKDRGTTPLVVGDLERGDHKVELSKAGFDAMQAYLSISAGAPSSRDYVLHALPAPEIPTSIAAAPVVRESNVAMADEIPTGSISDQFRSSASSRDTHRHHKKGHHRH